MLDSIIDYAQKDAHDIHSRLTITPEDKLTKEDKIFKGEELFFAINILRIVLSYYILIEIGFKKEFIEKKIKEMQRKITYAWDLYKLENNQ